jgi:hypothetical protein
MLTNKKFYKNKNITKYHKKKYIFKKIPSKIENNIIKFKPIIINYIKEKYNLLYEKFKIILEIKNLLNIKKNHKIYYINILPHNILINNFKIIIKNIIPIFINNNNNNIIILNFFKNYNEYINKINKLSIKEKNTLIKLPKFSFKIKNNKHNFNPLLTIKFSNYYLTNNIEKFIIKICYSPIFVLN